jgi:flagellar biosynthesis anti-sigma factor FlgM
MKSVTGNPALDAYQRMAVTGISPANPPREVESSPVRAQGVPPAARVSISDRARELALEAPAAVDTEKVAALQAKIRDGQFRVDSAVVARRMLETLG